MVSLMQLLVLGALVSLNEAISASVRSGLSLSSSMSMRVKSKAEITARMTPESAAKTLRTIVSKRRSEFMSLIQRDDDEQDDDDEQEEVPKAQNASAARTLMQLGARSFAKGRVSTRDLNAANEKLNEMLTEVSDALEAEESRCKTEDENQRNAMESMRGLVSEFNSKAAGARSQVIHSQGVITSNSQLITETREDFNNLLIQCEKDKRDIEAQIQIVKSDQATMVRVITAIGSCTDSDDPGENAARGTFLQTPKALLNQIMGRFTSDIARESFLGNMVFEKGFSSEQDAADEMGEKGLTAMDDEMSARDDEHDDDGYDPITDKDGETHGENEMWTEDSDDDDGDLSLVQGITRRKRHYRHKAREDSTTTTTTTCNDPLNPACNAPVSTAAPPTDPPVMDCAPNNKCSLATNPQCQVIKDRFLLVQTEIEEKGDDLEAEKRNKYEYCRKEEKAMTEQIADLENTVSQARTALAEGTEAQNLAEVNSHVQAEQHAKSAKEYTRTMKECCTNQNNAKSEMCALEKVRGEINNLDGQKKFMVDCEMSSWDADPCPVTCGGGVRKSRRTVVTHAQYGGKACGPLEKEEQCGEDVCPVNCQVNEWGAWSECSSDCQGGVRERVRDVAVHASNGGLPCPHTEEINACGFGSCNRQCVLAHWSEWESCSKACGGGSKRRTRKVKTPARGTGTCQAADHSDRLQFTGCNTQPCSSLLYNLRAQAAPGSALRSARYFHCNNKIDVTLMLDSSGSLGWYGWWRSKLIAKTLVTQLPKNANDADIMMSVLKFSGPTYHSEWVKCTRSTSALSQDYLENTCRIKWVPTGDGENQPRFTADGAAFATRVYAESFMRRTTLTSMALGEAQANLKNGRSDAASVVIVLTDGRPLSQRDTQKAAERLQAEAKVIWIPIGRRAPRELIKKMASKPRGDHVISVYSFWSLRYWWSFDNLINKITTTACKDVEL